MGDKTKYGILILFGFFLYVNCEHFEFGDKGTACILLDIDAEFNLTYNDGTTFQEAEIFDLHGATVVNRSSLCSDSLFLNNSLLMIRLFPSGEHVEFSFRRQLGAIIMHVAFFLNPVKHFRNINDTLPVEMKDYMGLNVGAIATSNYSFECHTLQDLYFIFDAPFFMTMAVTNIQVQPYSVVNSTFGPAKECKKDLVTTTEPSDVTTATEPGQTTTAFEPKSSTSHTKTTEPLIQSSTQHDVNTTTESHTTPSITAPSITTPSITTQDMTTTPITTQPRPSGRPKFIVKNNGTVCIVIEGFIMFDIQYKKKDNTTGVISNITVPNDAAVHGNCHLNDSAQEITIIFFDVSWTLNIIITKDAVKGVREQVQGGQNTYTWSKLNLSYFADSHFPDAKNAGGKHYAKTIGAITNLKANTDGSFKCNAEEVINVDKDVRMTLTDVQYRAFGKSGSSDFTNNDVTECAADNHSSGGVGDDDSKLGVILGCVFGGLAVIILVVGVIWYRRKFKTVRTGTSYDQIS